MLYGLIKEEPDKTPAEYADILDISIGNFYTLKGSIKKKLALIEEMDKRKKVK